MGTENHSSEAKATGHPCIVMDGHGHLQIEWKLAPVIGAAFVLAGMTLGFLCLQWLPFVSRTEATAAHSLIEQEISTQKLQLASHDTRLEDMEKWRATQMEAMGRIEANQEESLRQVGVMQQQLNILLQQRRDRR